MKFVMTAMALCAAVLIGTGAVMGAADIRAAESSSQPALPPPTSEPDLHPVENPVFADIVEMYRKNVSENWANYKGKTATGILNTKELDTVSSEWLTKYKNHTLATVRYSIEDNHLFIIGGSGILEGYSYDDGTITHLFSGTKKATFYYKHIWIYDNNGDGESSSTSESGSIHEPISAFWEIQDGKLVLTKAYKDFERSSEERIAKSLCAQPEMLEDGTIIGEWESRENKIEPVTSLKHSAPLSEVAPLTGEPATEPITEPATEPTEPVTEPTEPVTEPTEPEQHSVENPVFADIVEMYRKNVSENWANYKGKTATGILNTKELDTVSSKWLTTYKDKTLSEIGYYISGDILYIMQGYDLIEGYYYENDTITHLFSDADKTRFMYKGVSCKDSEGNSVTAIWKIQDGKLILTEAYKDTEESCWRSFCAQPEMLEDGTIVGEWEPFDQPVLPFMGLSSTPLSKVAPLNGEPATEPTESPLGDVNGDTTINASDAANVLIAAAAAGAGRELGLTEAQIRAADVNEDSTVNASDAAVILIYSAAVGAGNEDAKISDFVRK